MPNAKGRKEMLSQAAKDRNLEGACVRIDQNASLQLLAVLAGLRLTGAR